MLKPIKVLEAKPLTGLCELKDSREKLLTWEGIKPNGWWTGGQQPMKKGDQPIPNLTDDCMATRELLDVLLFMVIILLLKLIAC